MKTSIQIGVFAAKLAALVPAVLAKVLSVLPDGVTADEAEAIALTALDGEDIKILIRGIDVLDDESERHLIAFTARTVRNIVVAATGPKAA